MQKCTSKFTALSLEERCITLKTLVKYLDVHFDGNYTSIPRCQKPSKALDVSKQLFSYALVFLKSIITYAAPTL